MSEGEAGIVMIPTRNAAEAKEIMTKLFGPTYIGNGWNVFRDDEDDWFESVGATMPLREFFNRFVAKQ